LRGSSPPHDGGIERGIFTIRVVGESELELDPQQSDAVQAAVRELMAPPAGDADPWWQAGMEEALSPPEAGAQGDATARPRRTLGAERA
jgi:hypothetical protein